MLVCSIVSDFTLKENLGHNLAILLANNLKSLEGKMANSGIYWIDITFDYCVRLLYQVAGMMGITYEEINVWLFVIILPAILLFSFTLNLYFILRLNQKNKINDA